MRGDLLKAVDLLLRIVKPALLPVSDHEGEVLVQRADSPFVVQHALLLVRLELEDARLVEVREPAQEADLGQVPELLEHLHGLRDVPLRLQLLVLEDQVQPEVVVVKRLQSQQCVLSANS